MTTYQTKQVEVAAMQFDGSNHEAVMDFMDGHNGSEGVSFLMGDTVYIASKDGMITGNVGDYVVKFPDGELYLYEEQVFNLTYGVAETAA